LPGRAPESAGWRWLPSRNLLEVARTPLRAGAAPERVVARFGASATDPRSPAAAAAAPTPPRRSRPRPARPLVARFAAQGATASGVDVALGGAEGSVARVLRRYLSGTYEIHADGLTPSRRRASQAATPPAG
jgi:hypothetical protein